jgi:hypothetical protein
MKTYIDNKDKTCETCGKGRYTETEFFDDMDGVLHCTVCNSKVIRHITLEGNKMTETEKTKYYETIRTFTDVALLKEYTEVVFDSSMSKKGFDENIDKVEICKAEILGRML